MSSDSCGCRGCCRFPNGALGIAALCLGIVAFAMGTTANTWCSYVRVDLTDGTAGNLPADEDFGFGLASREYVTDIDYSDYYSDWICVEWSEYERQNFLDGRWRAARSLGTAANSLGIVVLVVAIVLSCVSMPKMFLNLVAIGSALAGLFEILTLIALSSDICKDFDCQFSSGAGLSIGSSLAYFINACIIFKIPMYQDQEDGFVSGEPAPAYSDPVASMPPAGPPPGSVSVTQQIMSDGTKKTIRTTVNADGSRTVEETIEAPPMASAQLVEPAKAY